MCFKKLLKIILSFLLAIYMPVALISPVFAESTETVTIQGELYQEGQFPKKRSDNLKLKSSKLASSNKSDIESHILEGLKAKDTYIYLDSYTYTYDEISSIYFGIINEHPELFYVYSRISARVNSNDIVTRITPTYLDYTDEDIEMFNQTTQKVLNMVENGWTDFQKILFIHDYMATHCEYDGTYSKYNAYNNIVEGSSVCQGYALAFKFYMNELSIPCEYISTSGGNHAWNAVLVDDEYYYVDVTFDDPVLTTPNENYCRHKYFLVTTDEIHSTDSSIDEAHFYTDWLKGDRTDAYNTIVTGPSRLNGKTSFIYDVTQAITQKGSNLYYSTISGRTTSLFQFNVKTNKISTIFNFTDAWYTTSGGIYTTAYSETLYFDSYFYINGAKKIYRVDLSGNSKVIVELTSAQSQLGNIYTMSIKNGILTYEVSSKPNSTDNVYSYDYVITLDVTKLNVDDLLYILEGQNDHIIVTFEPAGASAELTYTSSNPDTVSVDDDGKVTGLSHGTAVITVTTDNDISASIEVTVGHDYDAGVVTKAPTCEEEGIKTHTCSKCGAQFEEPIAPTGHDYDEGTIVHAATCTQDGLKVYTCRHDSTHTMEETLKALGHDYQKVSQNNHAIVYECTRCHDQYTVEVENNDIDINTNIDSSSQIEDIEVNDNAKDSISSALLDRINEAIEDEDPNTSSEAIKAAIDAGHSLHAELNIETEPDSATQSLLNKIDLNESEVIAYVGVSISIVDGDKVLGEISSVSLLGITVELKDYNPDLDYRIVTVVDGKVIDTGAIVDENGKATVDISELTPVVVLHDHSYTDEITLQATPTTDGKVYHECACGHSYTSTIPAASHIEGVEIVYTGKTLQPQAIVKDANGDIISSDYYTLSCSKSIKNVGIYTVIVSFNGLYDGTASATMTVNPYATTISKLTKKKKAFKATWKKKSSQVTGYQLQYSLNSDFSSAKTVKIKKYKTTSKTVSKLKAKKTYYVRVRTYKTVSGKTYYSTWSASKSVKTK